LRDAFYNKIWNYDICEKYSIFSSSSASPLKGAHKIIEALPIILKSFPTAKLYLTGNDPRGNGKPMHYLKRTGYQKYLCKLMDKYHVNDAVVFTGYLNEEQMANRCVESNVYVLPSCIENSPNSLCEAMLMGVPSVATDVGGVPNLLESCKDGYLYPFDEPYMLAYRVMQLFSDKDMALRMSKNARERALLRHDRLLNGKTMYQIYRTIAENRGLQ
jgi:glycosyltransferase involved in cell wall biosynthesis